MHTNGDLQQMNELNKVIVNGYLRDINICDEINNIIKGYTQIVPILDYYKQEIDNRVAVLNNNNDIMTEDVLVCDRGCFNFNN